ncbi:hypothetical protein [Acidovorax sp. JHL-9]|nr:hypothetical protein [Acidovorax sp. JHL-9]
MGTPLARHCTPVPPTHPAGNRPARPAHRPPMAAAPDQSTTT